MPRPWRIEYAGACYHAINRGNYRRSLFDGHGAAEAFERTLGEAAERYNWQLHAYVIMRNHFHLAVETPEPNLSIGMKWLQGTWIRRYNGFRRLIGRPFQGRYKALLVEPDRPFGEVCHYIHLNPVRAGVVTAARIRDYRWSSLHWFPQKKRPSWLTPDTVLGQAGGLADSRAGWRSYLSYLEFLATDARAKKELISERLSRGWCLGSRGFRKEMKEEAAERGAELDRERFGGLEPDHYQAEREAAWEERLQEAAEAARIDLGKLGPRKSDPDKVLLAAVLKRSTSVTNGWLAHRLAMGQPASASQFVRRMLLDDKGRASVERVLSTFKT